MIAIIDYDIGNVSSIVNMLQRIGLKSKVTSCVDDVLEATHVILPGNGSYDACISNLRSSGLVPALEHQALVAKIPFLGICVGAQLLGHSSAEGVEAGLGWIDMIVKRFPSYDGFRVPHMGWNTVNCVKSSSRFAQALENDARFYFVHSYYMEPSNKADILMETNYSVKFASAVAHDNIVGVQFHPEKSHRFGKMLFQSFVG